MRALALLGHPALPLVLLGLLVAWSGALVVLALAAPLAPAWTAGLLSFCGYNPARGLVAGETFLALLAQAYLSGLLVVWLFWDELHRRVASGRRGQSLAVAITIVPLLGAALAFHSGRAAFATPDDRLLRGALPVPAFDLVDQQGHAVSATALGGKVVLVTFFYGHCYESCPLLVHGLQATLDRFPAEGTGRELLALGITVDPQRDRPPDLASLGQRWGLDGRRFLLLSGEVAAVERALDGFGVNRQASGDGEIEHSNLVLLLDKQGRQAYAADGLAVDLDELARAAGKLLQN